MKIIGAQIESKIQATKFSKHTVIGTANEDMQAAISKADLASYQVLFQTYQNLQNIYVVQEHYFNNNNNLKIEAKPIYENQEENQM
jgi:hypothetical protein